METKYNYFQAVLAAIEYYIAENEIKVVGPGAVDYDELYNELFVSDAVTGNTSGSYTFSTWKAANCVCHNEDLLEAALYEFGYENVLSEKVCNPEWCDVMIRCYLLTSCLNAFLDGVVDDVEEYYMLHNMEE